MKTKLFIAFLLFMAALVSHQASAQTVGMENRYQFGNFDQNGTVTVSIECKSTLYLHQDRKGLNFWTFANAQMNSTFFGFFALGVGQRFNLKTEAPFPSFIEFGIGMGVQSIPKPQLIQVNDSTYRMINRQCPMRGMGYVNAVFPIRWGDVYHPLIVQTGIDMSFDPRDLTVDFTYRYRAIVALQVTNSIDDINLLVGLHAERTIANGITLRCHFDEQRFQMFAVAGYNYDIKAFTGGGGLYMKF